MIVKLHPGVKNDVTINGGVLQLAINVLERAGKQEIVDELKLSAKRIESSERHASFVAVDFTDKVPLYVVEDLIQNQLAWEKNSFSAMRLVFSDNSTATYIDAPTDLAKEQAEEQLQTLDFYVKQLNEYFENHRFDVTEILGL